MPLAAGPVAALSHSQLLLFLAQLSLLLATASVLGRLAVRAGWPAVSGELLAGVLLGPSVLGHVPFVARHLIPGDSFAFLDAVGQFTVILLVGLAGLHTDLGTLRRHRVKAATTSLGGLVVPFVLGFGGALLLPLGRLAGDGTDPVTFALFLGVAMSVSALPVIAKTLLDLGLLHRRVGQLTMTSGTVADTIGWFVLSLVAASAAGGLTRGLLVLSVAKLALFLLVTVTVGRLLVRHVMRLALRTGSQGAPLAAAVALLLAAGACTHALGFEALLGAFSCGLLIGSTPGLRPARDIAALQTFVQAVLAPVFFALAGLRVDLSALARPEVLGAAAAILAIAVTGKFAGVYAGARVGGVGHWESVALGSALNARGVVEIVVAGLGLQLGVLNTTSYTIILLLAIGTSLMAPPGLRYAMRGVPGTPQEEEQLRARGAAAEPPASAALGRGGGSSG